ncbi:MAG: hypothetical protein ACREUS_15415 [Burkholderiales bacterium]
MAQLGQTDPVTLACTGKTLAYTPDLSRQMEVREPFDFHVVVSLSLGRLTSAHVVDAHSFELRDAGDAVFFVRDRSVAGRKAFEWISISRVSGRYAHFIAFRDDASGSLESPLLITAAGCEIAT